VCLDGVPQRKLAVDLVAVAPANPLTLDVVAGLKVGDDPLHRTLRDADLHRDIPQTDLGLASDEQQHVRMVAEERPCRSVVRGL